MEEINNNKGNIMSEIELRVTNLEKEYKELQASLKNIETIITKWDVRISDTRYLNCPYHIQRMDIAEKKLEKLEEYIEEFKPKWTKLMAYGTVLLVISQLVIQLVVAPSISNFFEKPQQTTIQKTN